MLPYIRTTPVGRVVVIVSMAISILLFVFALNYQDIFFALGALGQLLFIIVGDKVNQYSSTAFYDKKETQVEFIRDFTLGLIALFAFIAISITVPLTLKVPLSKAQIPQTLVPTISFVFLINQGVAEEKLFRGGLTNLFMKWSNSAIAAAVGSALVFGLYHIPAEQGILLNLVIITLSGFVVALMDIYGRHELISIVAHMLNNGLAFLYASVVGINLAAIGILPHLAVILH